jgi:hypothetical protein
MPKRKWLRVSLVQARIRSSDILELVKESKIFRDSLPEGGTIQRCKKLNHATYWTKGKVRALKSWTVPPLPYRETQCFSERICGLLHICDCAAFEPVQRRFLNVRNKGSLESRLSRGPFNELLSRIVHELLRLAMGTIMPQFRPADVKSRPCKQSPNEARC